MRASDAGRLDPSSLHAKIGRRHTLCTEGHGAEGKRAADRRDVVDLVGHYEDASLTDLQLGKIVLQVNQSAGAHGIKPPVK